MVKVESFLLNHTKVKAPFVRKCGTQQGEKKGDTISKFDLRFFTNLMKKKCQQQQQFIL